MARKMLVILLVLLLPALATAEVWVGGQIGGTFTSDTSVDFKAPPLKGTLGGISTDAGVAAGLIVGYNFDARQGFPKWAEYFGVAVDFTYNSFNQPGQTVSGAIIPRFVGAVELPGVSGSQYALSFLLRAQYPFMADERFPKGRLFPFVMFGPAVVWTDAGSYGTSSNFGLVTEIGLDFFIIPQLSIGPAFRYRHVFDGPGYEWRRAQNFVQIDAPGLDQFTVMARVAYHF